MLARDAELKSSDLETNATQAEIDLAVSKVRNIGGQTPLPLYTSGTRPVATADWERKLIVVQDPGEPSQVQACVPNSSGGYEWIGVQQSS